jgi:hypothetical protein
MPFGEPVAAPNADPVALSLSTQQDPASALATVPVPARANGASPAVDQAQAAKPGPARKKPAPQ